MTENRPIFENKRWNNLVNLLISVFSIGLDVLLLTLLYSNQVKIINMIVLITKKGIPVEKLIQFTLNTVHICGIVGSFPVGHIAEQSSSIVALHCGAYIFIESSSVDHPKKLT